MIDTDLLVGMDAQVHALRQNLLFLMHDIPAQNVLLRGPRGSGRRSLLHAVVNDVNERDGGSRLKILDIAGLHELSTLEADVFHSHRNSLRSSTKYVVFVENLHLEEAPAQVAHCRAILDLCATTRNPNWILVATCTDQMNARTFAMSGLDEAPEADIYDMFGLHIVAEEPTKARFLEWIVRLCERKGVKIARDIITMRACQYADERKSYSFLTARNFATYLESEQKFMDMGGHLLLDPKQVKQGPQVLDWERLINES